MNWLLRRLREPSTWRGLVWLATVAGLSLRPDQAEAIVTVGMALAGLLGVFLSEEPKAIHVQLPPIELVSKKDRPVYRAGAGPERGDPAADQLRQSVPAESRSEVDTQPNRWDFGGWGDQ